MLKNIKAAIFDMDGTIIDSMGLWCKIDKEFLGKRGVIVPKTLKNSIEHLSFQDVAKYFKINFSLLESEEEIMEEWNKMAYIEYSNTIFLKDGVTEFLYLLKERGIKLAIATSNSKDLVEVVLKKNNVYHLFESFTFTDEVKTPKSSPDIYLLAAKRLDVSPETCIVFEDILPGIIGAKKAGMRVYGVYDQFSREDMDKIICEADGFIHKYRELEIV